MFKDIVTLNIIINMALCLIIIIWDGYFYFKVNEVERWAKLLYVFTAVIWLIRYILFFFNYSFWGKDAVNPPLLMLVTITLTSLAVGSIIRVQRVCGFCELKKDLLGLGKRIYLWTFKQH